MALADIYFPKLPNKDRDFGKSGFWRRLEVDQPAVYGRYKTFRAWMTGEVIVWRDAAVHRLAPLVIAAVDRNAEGEIDAKTMRFEFPLDPDQDYARLWAEGGKTCDWADPLHFHKLWRDRFVAFCSHVCSDITTLF